jgi:para-nitrobenzyl esterase
LLAGSAAGADAVMVNIHNFPRAETDMYFAKQVADYGIGKLNHNRALASIDSQSVVRMNRDTLYSSGIFDLDAGPLTIELPDPGKRFMSLQVVDEDHFTVEVVYAPGRYTYDRKRVGTRYIRPIIRTLVNGEDPKDLDIVHRLQDSIRVAQRSTGSFEIPNWDDASRTKARNALAVLHSLGTGPGMFGARDEVDPLDFVIGAAVGWGGNPRYAADYDGKHPERNDGKTVHRLTVKNVPVDGFWSVSVYNASGFFEKNTLGKYSLNNLTAKPARDGSITVQFGGCDKSTPNCLPIVPGWNYTVRLYRPRPQILDGTWVFPEAEPVP